MPPTPEGRNARAFRAAPGAAIVGPGHGGTMAPIPQVELATTLAYAQGGYTVALAVGSERQPANVLLDTGSSSLAFFAGRYDPARDAFAQSLSMVAALSVAILLVTAAVNVVVQRRSRRSPV